MSILIQCPTCSKKQTLKHKKCPACGCNLDSARKRTRGALPKYWVRYRLPDGKQKAELVGTSFTDAQALDGKRKGQRKEKKLFDVKPDHEWTFQQLTNWYLELEKVKSLKSYWLVELTLKKFNAVFGDRTVADVKLSDLENYQIRRLKEGKAPGTVDHEIRKPKTMVIAAFNNDLISQETYQTWQRIKKTLKKGEDERDRVLSIDEFNALMSAASPFLKPILALGFHCGMRRGEILKLEWTRHVDMKGRFIHLTADITKDSEARTIPMPDPVFTLLRGIIRNLADPHVFLWKGKPIGEFRGALRKACKKAGIVYGRFEPNGFVFHDTRHSFVTHARKAGVPESVIMAVTGHSTRTMFDRYNKVDADDTKQAMVNMQRYIDENVDQMLTKSKLEN
jgi:integrase